MALTLCSNCRLPVNQSAHRCPLCAAPMRSTTTAARSVPVAAAIALVATVALLSRKVAM